MKTNESKQSRFLLVQVPVTCYKSLLLFFVPVVLGMLISAAHVAFAQTQTEKEGETTYNEAYVKCGTKDEKTVKIVNGQRVETAGADGVVDNPCKFTDIIILAKSLITGWIVAGVIFATMGFAYAGLLYITAMGSQEKISHAHMIFIKTFWGFVFMLSAWLIAYTMENIFLAEKFTNKDTGWSFLRRE